MTQPTIGGKQRSANVNPFFFDQVAKIAPPMVAIICTAPNGIFRRIVLKLSNPNPSIINGPKVEIPPLGILPTVKRDKRSL
jgi:hypothetical protein